MIASLVVIAAAGWLSGPRSGNGQSNVGAAIVAAMKDADDRAELRAAPGALADARALSALDVQLVQAREGRLRRQVESERAGPAEAGLDTHVAGLKHGMTWDELLTNVGKLPAPGAFYIALPTKIVDAATPPRAPSR